MSRLFLSIILTCIVGFACGPDVPPQIITKPDERSAQVLVIYKANDKDSENIALAYKKARAIPDKNLLALRITSTGEEMPTNEYWSEIVKPVKEHIEKNKLNINFLLLIRGVPIRLDDGAGYSVDASLMLDAHPRWKEKPLEPMPKSGLEEEHFLRCRNPYFGSIEPFDNKKYGFYLAARLDGYTPEDAIKLIANSLKAQPHEGEFFFDAAPHRNEGGYGNTQKAMYRAKDLLEKKGFKAVLDESAQFIGYKSNLMGYVSWGSNDNAFSESAYRSLRFLPGAIAETYVSTSGRTFRQTTGGQSLIADLIRQGVTGVKGYVSEPFTIALAQVDILFDRYTDGMSLVESFWSASVVLKWKDVVIGDPLCSPFK